MLRNREIVGRFALTTFKWVSMPSFLCESSPTGQYTS